MKREYNEFFSIKSYLDALDYFQFTLVCHSNINTFYVCHGVRKVGKYCTEWLLPARVPETPSNNYQSLTFQCMFIHLYNYSHYIMILPVCFLSTPVSPWAPPDQESPESNVIYEYQECHRAVGSLTLTLCLRMFSDPEVPFSCFFLSFLDGLSKQGPDHFIPRTVHQD